MVKILKITDIKIRKLTSDGKLRAIVSITLDNAFAVHDIKVIKGKDRLFVAMPNRKSPKNGFIDIVHPISSSMRRYLENTILDVYSSSIT